MKNTFEIGSKLKKMRIAKGMTREELSAALGASPSAIAMYELGERIPRDEMKLKIANFFGESIESIFFN